MSERPLSPRPSIAFVINSLAGGGAERVMTTLLTASIDERTRFDLRLILLDRDAAAYEVPDWITVEQLDCRHSLWRAVPALLSALRRNPPLAVISFLTRANVAAILATSLLRIPVIISERVNTSSHLGSGPAASLAKALVRWSYPRARRVIAVSPGVGADLRDCFGIAASKITVIANPIHGAEIRRQGALNPGTLTSRPFVMAMGRLVPNKNFSMLIDAYQRANLTEDLLILGEGPQRAALAAQIASLGLNGRVHLPGFSANPFSILQQASFFVLPSNAEGFPNSLLEAMSLGIPVISTNCLSGPAEVLAELPREQIAAGVVMAEHGILVATDHRDDMASALRHMATAECQNHYRARATARAGDFTVERAKDAYWRVIYQEVGMHPVTAPGAAIDMVSG
jgi:glycosyltransferase involved in cell wall biosynthesis